MRLNLSEIAQCLNLDPPETDPEIGGVAIDSRKVKPGDLFVCLAGENVDGHDFASAAVNAGAAAVLASRPLTGIPAPVLQAQDSSIALGALARYWRNRSSAKIVCITGTAGKTTLKDTLASILAETGTVTATSGNLNNQIGLPLSILACEGNEDFWVLEAGISHAGDMEYLADIVRPDLAVIINVGAGHTEGLGDNGVAWHKTRLLTALAPGGMALINADYPDLLTETTRLAVDFKRFSPGSGQADFRVVSSTAGHHVLDLAGKEESFDTPFTASFGAEIVLAAAAAATMLGAAPAQIRAGFASVALPPGRFTHISAGNFRIIDDTYNANPLSMTQALKSAAREAARLSLPFIAVLGEMRELGSQAEAAHIQLGHELGELAPLAIFWKGSMEAGIRAGLQQHPATSGMAPVSLGDASSFISQWEELKLPGQALVLFKGSRSNRMEQYLSALVSHAGERNVL